MIDCSHDPDDITSAIQRAIDPSFRRSLRNLVNPYGDGRAAERIIDRLISAPIDTGLVQKRFLDL